MEATDTLTAEHRVILRVIAALGTATDRLEAGDPVDAAIFLDAADFISGFADAYHHHKEEGMLFPAMQEAGIPSQGGPIGVMLAEHDRGRALTRAMREAATRFSAGDESAREEIAEAARGYAELLTQHIAKEDDILYPMANRAMDEAAQTQLCEDCRTADAEADRQAQQAHYLALADSIEERLGR